MDTFSEVKKMVDIRKGLSTQIANLKGKLNHIEDKIEKTCPHKDVEKIREYSGHRAEYYYYCPVCERYIGYTEYREYCIRNNLKQ